MLLNIHSRICTCTHTHQTNIVGHIPPSFADEDFARQQPDEYHCVICKRVPSTPLRSECCPNALYCETCSKKTTHCPVHNQVHTFKCDKPLKSTLQSYRVRCPYKCGWKDKMYRLKQHLPSHSKLASLSLSPPPHTHTHTLTHNNTFHQLLITVNLVKQTVLNKLLRHRKSLVKR